MPTINISDYFYELPEGKIAKYPLPERDQSKLLVWREGEISSTVFAGIDHFLPGNSLLVSNNTRVIHARFLFIRPTGARIEIFFLEPWKPKEYHISFQQQNSAEWKCLVGNAKKWKNGILEQKVNLGGNTVHLQAELIERVGDAFIIRFSWEPSVTFAEVIEGAGTIPIPPYLDRKEEESDNLRYQTIYAKFNGSVAAPTAGLHFTDPVFRKLVSKGIDFAELTLHVGAGTFLPVKSDLISGHQMHTETVIIDKKFLLKLIHHTGKIIAVGTTSVRSLESLYWLGLKVGYSDLLHVSQWEPYQSTPEMPVKQVLQNLLRWMNVQNLEQMTFTTSVMIVPGYKFQLIDGMITNFHQPKSTLLLLIAAFIGLDWQNVYDYALKNDFRFLSYGDSNLYLKDRISGEAFSNRISVIEYRAT
jgi:S-adenosylmethionine:tRNA ribosyltransferase-isomerase